MRTLTLHNSRPQHLSSLLFLFVVCAFGCSVAEPKTSANTNSTSLTNLSEAANSTSASKGATIQIDPNGPADTVRAFYRDLREKKFREAIFMTNLRPAIEGLTDSELKDFSVDFEALAGQVPAEI